MVQIDQHHLQCFFSLIPGKVLSTPPCLPGGAVDGICGLLGGWAATPSPEISPDALCSSRGEVWCVRTQDELSLGLPSFDDASAVFRLHWIKRNLVGQFLGFQRSAMQRTIEGFCAVRSVSHCSVLYKQWRVKEVTGGR